MPNESNPLEFDRDCVPESERHNANAVADFDWPQIFESLDAEMESAEKELSAEEFAKLSGVMVRLLSWCLSGRDTQGMGLGVSVGGRCIALVAAVAPQAVDGSQVEVAAKLGISKQALSATFADARAHVRRLKNARG